MNAEASLFKASPLLLALVLAASGCQSVPELDNGAVDSVVEVAQLRDQTLRALTNFNFSGGLGIWTDTESIPARIRWSQAGDDVNLILSGPLGMGELQLAEKPGLVTLFRGKTLMTSGTSTDDVVQRGLGLTAPVPISELKQWVRGLSGTGDAIKRDSDGKLTSLRYLDESGVRWSVRFKRYQSIGGFSLPALITASGGAYSVRLLLKNWQLSSDMSDSVANEPNKRLSIPGR